MVSNQVVLIFAVLLTLFTIHNDLGYSGFELKLNFSVTGEGPQVAANILKSGK